MLDLTNQLVLKKDFLLGCRYKEFDFITKAEQAFDKPTKDKDYDNIMDYFSNVSFTAIYNRSYSQRYAFQVEATPERKRTTNVVATALLEYKYSDKSFTKVAVNTNSILSFVFKKTLNSLWSVSVGAQIPLPGLFQPGAKLGFQIDLNIWLKL